MVSPSSLSEEDLDRELTTASSKLIKFLRSAEGDFMVLGAGGKMGPSLSLMLRSGIEGAGIQRRVIAVSKFSSRGVRVRLQSAGVETVVADLLDEDGLRAVPNIENVVVMAAQKFGTTGREHDSWALNTYLPGRIAEKFRDSRIVHFSTGNVYPFVSVRSRGSKESGAPMPLGEYAQSRLGGERIFEHFSRKYGTRVVTLRLNYAVELRYGVLHDIAKAVIERRPIELNMGYVNVIWQGDASDIAIRSLRLARSPPMILNLTGPEKISVRWAATEFGRLLGVRPVFRNSEEGTALLNDATSALKVFGRPRVSLKQMMVWVANWLKGGGRSLDKPTHFQERAGRF